MKRIVEIGFVPPRCLQIRYESGETVTADFAPVVAMGGVFTRLADDAFFAQVRIGENGRSIEWPGGLDFCADALLEEAHAVR